MASPLETGVSAECPRYGFAGRSGAWPPPDPEKGIAAPSAKRDGGEFFETPFGKRQSENYPLSPETASGPFPFPPFFESSYLPGDAIEGTREHPFVASTETAACFMNKRVLCSNVQRVAKILREAGLAVDYDIWAFTLARLRLWCPAGWYEYKGWPRPKDWPRPQRWPDLTAESLLLCGKGAPFERRADIPPKVFAIVERAIAAAMVMRPSGLSPSGVTRVLNITAAFRREHKLWALGAIDANKKELRMQSKRRSAKTDKSRAANNARKAAERREDGKMTRAEYLYRAALVREACALAGISRDTFDRRARRDPVERERLLDAARAARAESPTGTDNNKKDTSVSRSHLPQPLQRQPERKGAKRHSEGEAERLPPSGGGGDADRAPAVEPPPSGLHSPESQGTYQRRDSWPKRRAA